MKIVSYGLKLKRTGEILRWTENNGYVSLNVYDGPEWLAPLKEIAEYTRYNSAPYYNASLEWPQHNFKASELGVFTVEIERNEKYIAVKLPSIIEVLEYKYYKYPKDDMMKAYLKEAKQATCPGNNYFYSIFDLKDWVRWKEDIKTKGRKRWLDVNDMQK